MEIKKRIDMRMKDNNVLRGNVHIFDDEVFISYQNAEYRSFEELKKAFPDLEVLVIGDLAFVKALDEAGFPVRGMEKRRVSVHITVPTQIRDKLLADAAEDGCNISTVVEQILKKHYKL